MVDTPSRRAASDGLKSSTAISTSSGSIEAEPTTECRYLMLDFSHDGQVITVGKGVASVLKGEQL